MIITVFGANGRVGSLVVEQAIARGYNVVGFVHKATRIEERSNLTIREGDIYNPSQVADAIEGSDAVISTLGSWGTPKKDILATGMSHIIPAMKTYGISRIVSLTGADARAPGDRLTLTHRATHAVFSITAGKVLNDGEKHIQQLHKSNLDWTVLRSPIMRSDLAASDYRLDSERPLPWATIPRELVARCLIDQLEDTSWHQSSPYITNR